MTRHLPDEILSEILCPALRVSDELFRRNSTTTFATYTESTSAYLLVCKAWLRVSTPLLYNVVVLRSKAQAKALDVTLKKNVDLGRLIKKLRVEGGFGPSMLCILKNASAIIDLFLSLQIHGSDACSGLVQGLPLINPTLLILSDNPNRPLQNQNAELLTIALTDASRDKWSNLTTIVFPYDRIPNCATHRALFLSLNRITNLSFVSFPTPAFPFHHQSTLNLWRHIELIASLPNIDTIELRGLHGARHWQALFSCLPIGSLAQSKVRAAFAENTLKPAPSPITAPPPTNPAFIPMASSSQATTDLVWERVLSFAMITTPPSFPLKTILRIRPHKWKGSSHNLQYLLVSKQFYRLGLQFLYRCPLIIGSRIKHFDQCLGAKSSLAGHIQTLYVSSAATISQASSRPISIFAQANSLVRLIGDGFTVDWPNFCALGQSAGRTLVELTGIILAIRDNQIKPTAIEPIVFACFTALRILEMSIDSKGDIRLRVANNSDRQAVSSGFPALECLRQNFHVSNEKIYLLLAEMELPCLHHLDGGNPDSGNFLIKHGHKIRKIKLTRPNTARILALCPSLTTLDAILGSRLADTTYSFSLRYSPRHHSLAKVVIDKTVQKPKSKDQLDWEEIFDAMEPAHFSALGEIQIKQCVWPNNEHDIQRSQWVKCSDRLLKEYGIKITNKEGVHWRPRLKAPRR